VSVALVIQQAKRMRRITLPYVAYLALPHFITLHHKRHDFQKKKLLNIKCVLIFCTVVSAAFLTLRGTERDITNVLRSSCKVPAIIATFQGHLRFLEGFPKKY
jgi:hypothetical protein